MLKFGELIIVTISYIIPQGVSASYLPRLSIKYTNYELLPSIKALDTTWKNLYLIKTSI